VIPWFSPDMGEAMGRTLNIRNDRSPSELRLLARRERNGRVAARMIAIANALEGMTRAEAARLAGMERQALRDAVVRYNAEGLAGLTDRPKGHPLRKLSEAEEAAFAAAIFRGPDPDKDGVSAWTRPDLCRWLEAHVRKTYHPSSLTRVLRRMGLSRQKVRPVHPQADIRAQARFKKRGCARQ
jgi:putative transposase